MNTSKVNNKTEFFGIFDECIELELIKILYKFNDNNNFKEKMIQLIEKKEKLQIEIDNMFAINFMSTSQNINFPIVCK